MVIGFDGSRAFQEGRTGTENYSYQLLKALAEIDQKNTYRVYLRSQTITDAIVQVIDGFPGNFQFKKVTWPRLWTQGGLAMQTFKDKLDVLFVPAHTLPVARKPGLKAVITVHDLGSEYLPSMHQVKQRVYLGFMQKYQLQTATKIIAVSNATKEDLVKRIGIDPEQVSVVYEGFDRKLFKSVKGDLLVDSLNHYNLKPKTYYLFVGTVQPRKNLESLIKAFYSVIPRTKYEGFFMVGEDSLLVVQNDNLKLVIVGQKGWMSDEIYKLPKKLGIEDRVKFLGYVPEKDLPALYSGAIALTFPSLFEGFGLPILEAQASGCPVLTSSVSSMPEVAGKGAIFVNPYSVDDIVKGIAEIVDEDTKRGVIKAGFENIKRFSWEKCARETRKVLEML